jgi:ketosteroid isomerase-like protein
VAEANVEIVRRVFEAWRRNDPDAAFALMDEEIEWQPAQDEPETATLHGKAGVEGLLLQWANTFDDFRAEPIEFIDADDCVVVPLRIMGRMQGSGAEVTIEETHVFWIRDGKVVQVREFRTKAEGLRAAGLPDQPG